MADPRGKAVVVGAGLGGALMAVNLARAGFQVEVLERRPDPRRTGRPEGRSINLAISTRGLHALDLHAAELGLDHAADLRLVGERAAGRGKYHDCG